MTFDGFWKKQVRLANGNPIAALLNVQRNGLRPKGVAGFRSIEDARNIMAAEDGDMVPVHTDPRKISLERSGSALDIVREGIAEMMQALEEDGEGWEIDCLLVPEDVYAHVKAVIRDRESKFGYDKAWWKKRFPDLLGEPDQTPKPRFIMAYRIKLLPGDDFKFVLKRKAA